MSTCSWVPSVLLHSVLPRNYQLGGVMEGADETPAWIMGHHPWWYKMHPKSTSVALFWVANIYSHGHKNQGMQIREALVIVSLSDLLGVLLPVPLTLGSTALDILVSKQRTPLPEDTVGVPPNFKSKLTPGHFKLLVPRIQQASNASTIMAGIIDSDIHGEARLLVYNRGKKNSFGTQLVHWVICCFSYIHYWE